MKLTLYLISLEFYCTQRMLHGMELLIFALYGIAITLIIQLLSYRINKLEIKNIIIPIISTCIVLGTVGVIHKNMSDILKYDKEADGVISAGYSTLPLKENDQLLPNMFIEIGEYFNSLPNRKYGIYVPSTFEYNKFTFIKQYLLFSSKKLYLYEPDWVAYTYAKNNADSDKVNWGKNLYQAWFTMGQAYKNQVIVNNSLFSHILNKGNLNYAFFTNKKIVNIFLKNGWKIIVGGKSKGYYLIKRIN